MKVDHVLILSAGKGTRMGEIGKHLPKVLWPIFERSLIETQILFAKKLAPQAKIYANIFNYKEQVGNQLKKLDCEIIEELEVLDIGGAIHNLAQKLSYTGNLLVLNGDQFLIFDDSDFQLGIEKLESFDSLLFSFEVNSNDQYNSLKIEKDQFGGVTLNQDLPRDHMHDTYTGMSLLNLSRLKAVSGESKFFETVANPMINKVGVSRVGRVEYWDFGTLKRYSDSVRKLCTKTNSNFKKFLIENAIFDLTKQIENSYNTRSGYNFTPNYINDCKGSIILTRSKEPLLKTNQIVYDNLSVDIPI